MYSLSRIQVVAVKPVSLTERFRFTMPKMLSGAQLTVHSKMANLQEDDFILGVASYATSHIWSW
jgi:hypothetical protein